MPDWPYILDATSLPQIPQNLWVVPIEIVAGDQVLFYQTLPDYPANKGWTLNWSLRGVAGAAIDFVGVASGTGGDHQMLVLPATTLNWQPGQYTAQGYATNPNSGPNGTPERHVIFQGFITVKPNLAVADAGADQRTHAKRMLDMIESVLEGKASDDVLNSKIEGTEIYRIPIPHMLRFRSYYKAEVQAEEARAKIRAGRATGRNVLIRFSRPQ